MKNKFRTNKTIDKNYYYFGKSLIEVMLSPNGMNVKHITHNCGLISDVVIDCDNDSDSDSVSVSD